MRTARALRRHPQISRIQKAAFTVAKTRVPTRRQSATTPIWRSIDRVKARQAQRRKEAGALVKGGLRKRAGGGGRKGKYLFTGLLVCDVCKASFVLQNREYYCCASHWNGASCSNTIKVPRNAFVAARRGFRRALDPCGEGTDLAPNKRSDCTVLICFGHTLHEWLRRPCRVGQAECKLTRCDMRRSAWRSRTA